MFCPDISVIGKLPKGMGAIGTSMITSDWKAGMAEEKAGDALVIIQQGIVERSTESLDQ